MDMSTTSDESMTPNQRDVLALLADLEEREANDGSGVDLRIGADGRVRGQVETAEQRAERMGRWASIRSKAWAPVKSALGLDESAEAGDVLGKIVALKAMKKPSQLLLDLMVVVDPEARVIGPMTYADAFSAGVAMIAVGHDFVRPTHAVFDEEGDVIGSGMSVHEAVADAIRRAYTRERRELNRATEAIRRYKNARDALLSL